MALSTCKISGSPLETGIQNKAEPCRVNYNIVKVSHCMGSSLSPRLKYQYNEKGQCTVHALESIFKDSWGVYGMSNPYLCKDSKFLSSYHITRARNSEVQERIIVMRQPARAREDTGKIDIGVKRKAARLQRIAEGLTDKAQTKLKTAAAEHWSDGALEADLRRADLRARRRAMEDAFMALEFVKNIHDMMVRTMYQVPRNAESEGDKGLVEGLTIEKNGKALKIFPGKVSDDQITAMQRLAQDSNPVVSTAASKAIDELRRQWQIEEGDTLVFSMDESSDSETLISNLEIDDESEKA